MANQKSKRNKSFLVIKAVINILIKCFYSNGSIRMGEIIVRSAKTIDKATGEVSD